MEMNSNKKNDLIEAYRQRQDEFRLPLREGGWEKLAQELTPRPARHIRLLRRTGWVAAAVLLCLLLSVPLWIPAPEEGEMAGSRTAVVPPAAGDSTLETGPRAQEEPPASSWPGAAPSRRPSARRSVGPQAAAAPEYAALLAWEDEAADVAVSEAPLPATSPAPHRTIGPEPERQSADSYNLIAEARPARQGLPAGWAIGIMAGSNSAATGWGAGAGSHQSSNDPVDPTPPDDPDDPDKPSSPDEEPVVSKAAAAPLTRSTEMNRLRHRLPVSLGVSVRKRVWKRVAVESGLTYTLLRSDIQDDVRGNVGEQSLHYAGIPLKLNWIYWQRGKLSAYLSAGGMAEYCFSASRYRYNTYEEIEMNRWDLSVQASAGFQVEVAPPVSLFIEPGVSYYFDTNRSNYDLNTLRTERPANFTLQIGLRFSY